MSIRRTMLQGLSRTAWLGASALGLLWGCGDSGLPPIPGIQQKPLVVAFDQCSELETYLQDSATLEMRAQLIAARDQQWGPGYYAGGPEMMDTAGAMAPAADTRSGPTSFTQTNNQVAGVDESDFVKNDGTRIFVLSGNKLSLNRSWPADQLTTTATLEIEGWPRELALDGDRVTVFSQIYLPNDGMIAYGGYGMADAMCSRFMCGYWYGDHTKITVIDVADITHPQVISELYEPGAYNQSRRIDHSVRLVLSDAFRWPAEVQWWPSELSGPWQSDDAGKRREAYNKLIAANERIIRATPVEKWLPRAYRNDGSGVLTPEPIDCTQYRRTNAPTRLGLVTISTVDLAAAAGPAVKRTSVIAEPGQIYATASALYLASSHWWWWAAPGQVDYTYLHKFDLSDPTQAVYAGSGGVSGTVSSQFAMDEFEGTFHVATTIHSRIYEPFNQWGRLETTNRVSAVQLKDGWLQVVGQSPELEKGESIYSARFIGNTAYVSTFRQVDPLMVLDLSKPTQIKLIGSLEVPGYSTYLHPIDATHLLAIGQQLDMVTSPGGDVSSAGTQSLQLSIFDVSDPAHPARTFVQTVGTSNSWGSWSEALWDHKAFNYFPEKKLLAIPYTDWTYDPIDYWNSFTSELRVFSVDPAAGFTPRGAVSMKDVYRQVNDQNWVWYYTPNIRRSVIADDFVYAISDSGIRSTQVSDLSTPLATVTFNPYQDL